ncbi:hypothetical protein [Nonomuraea sp. NPDC001699]
MHTIRRVRTRRELKEFIELPHRLYRNDPNFVPPLRNECHNLLNRKRNPFFAYGQAELFIACRDGRVVGRVAAIHNPRHNATHQARDGFFGQFECVDDPAIARDLIEATAAWLRQHDLDTMIGPVNFTTNDECGLLVDGFDTAPAIMMPYNPVYYPALLETSGLTKIKDLWVWERGSQPPEERLLRIATHVQRRSQLTVRSIKLRDFDAEAARIKHVYDVAWQHNWGFTPMTDKEYAALAHRLRKIADPRLILLAESEGEPVAVLLVLPDINQALPAARGRLTTYGLPIGLLRLARAARRINRLRVVLLGVVPSFQQRGIETLLVIRAIEAMRAAGYHGGVELGWTLEDNDAINRYLLASRYSRSKTCRIYQRSL